jgi:hypothetical protein
LTSGHLSPANNSAAGKYRGGNPPFLIAPAFLNFVLKLRRYPFGLWGQDMMFGALSPLVAEMMEVAVVAAMS